MSDLLPTAKQFELLAADRFGFLEAYGFRRYPSLEQATPTSVTVVYLGSYVGFIFSLDVRDQYVDAEVVRVQDGRIMRNWDGGYSSGLFTHLVTKAGYRGGAAGRSGRGAQEISLQAQIDSWVQLLADAGQALLSDKPESLPR